ncbi:BPI fold-containing family B member 2, partial [Pelobates cultripes]
DLTVSIQDEADMYIPAPLHMGFSNVDNTLQDRCTDKKTSYGIWSKTTGLLSIQVNPACQTQRRPLQKAFGIIPIPELHEKKSSGGGILGNILNKGGLIGAGQKLLGNVVNLVGIKILEVNLPELNVKLVPNIGVQVSVDTSLHISGNLVIVGGIELKVGAGVLADVRVSKTKGGFPILAVTACKSILGDIDITVGGFG